MNAPEELMLFNLTHSLIQADLLKIENDLKVDLGVMPAKSDSQQASSDDYYPQVSAAIRAEAAEMALHYEIFYCLENFIRDLVSAQLLASEGEGWWNSAVPEAVKLNVMKSLEREREAGVTQRSADLIDYTTFGELGEIIQAKWEVFSDTFNNKKALSRIIAGLNLLRGPIAHCSPLATDEISRLQLALKDFFRLME